MVETCAGYGVDAGRRDGYPGCWVDAGRPSAAQARRAGPARRARRQLPRHRPQRDHRPGRLRPDRPLRHAGRRGHLDRAEAGWPDRITDHGQRRARPPIASRRAFAATARHGRRRARRCRRAGADREAERMAGGLFELRRDDITGWWVAVVVDREFDRARFARPAETPSSSPDSCPNCDDPAGGGVRRCERSSRMRSRSPAPSARRARPRRPARAGSRARAGRRRGLVGHDPRPAARSIARSHTRPLAIVFEMLARRARRAGRGARGRGRPTTSRSSRTAAARPAR